MRSLISSLLKNLRISDAISKDLRRLNSVRSGLGDQAAAYVGNGTNETVLATLANVDAGSALGLASRYSDEKTDTARNQYVARQANDPEVLARYAEVLGAAIGPDPDYLSGSKHAPLSLRVLFTLAGKGLVEVSNVWPRPMIKPESCALSPDFCVAVCKAAGGSAADLFDILFHDDARWTTLTDIRRLTDIFDFAPLARSHSGELLIAARRIGAGGKVTLIKQIHQWEMLSEPAVSSYLVDMTADGAKSVRQEAVQAMMTLPADQVLPVASERLSEGTAPVRASMVDLLAGSQAPEAMDILRDHLKTEKTARIKAAIESALLIKTQDTGESDEEDDGTSYLALDGSRVEIPPKAALHSKPEVIFGKEDLQLLSELIKKENAEIDRRNKMRTGSNRYVEPALPAGLADKIIKLFNGKPENYAVERQEAIGFFLNQTVPDKWTLQALSRMSQDRALRFAMRMSRGLDAAFHLNEYAAGPTYIVRYVNNENADYRILEDLNASGLNRVQYGPWGNRKIRKAGPGDLLRAEMAREWSNYDVADLPQEALWPLLAESFDVFDEAFGLRAAGDVVPSKNHAIRFLQALPKTPQRYYGPLLEIATGTTKTGRAEAREMLRGAPGLADRTIALLDDTRQDIRAGAAEWIADLDLREAVKPLRTRLKKEKSDIARAAILTALSRLGVELSDYVGPKALLTEAETLLKKAKFDKLNWLIGDHVPSFKYKNGQKVPPEVIKAWLFLANKLKQPGGNKLFDIYMDQLEPDSSKTFSTWVFDAWINYDTLRPSDADANAHAEQFADQSWKSMLRWDKTYTREQAFRSLYNGFKSQYFNSGAATKGLLALTKHTDAAHAAASVRNYLKVHGSRTSQASALLEVLAAKGDALSLQIVISAATRLKQKGVQAHAGTLVEAVAESHNWSMDELADRTIPTAGLNDQGVLELPCGHEEKPYSARMDDEFKLVVSNPDGKKIKSLPSGDDDATKASKKQLSASKRELKQVITLQGERLYEALCAERRWPVEDWLRDFRNHPVMGRLTERVIWLGSDVEGNILGAFRPTAEEDYLDSDDTEVDLQSFDSIRLAHGALMPSEQAGAWGRHLSDYEVKPLFTQFGRPLLTLEGEQGKESRIDDRKGWVTDTFTMRGAAARLGYERGEAMDGGYFNEYTKSFRSAGLCAVIEFSGNCLPEENVAAAAIHLEFAKMLGNNRRSRAVPLAEVPPVLLSECWNDYRALVAKGAYDPEWEKKMPWM